MLRKLFYLFLGVTVILFAQAIYIQVQSTTTNPTGACNPKSYLVFNRMTSDLTGCDNGTWKLLATGSTAPGTVTSVGLSRTNDTNVTATITGSPITTSGTINVALGWTGTLANARITNPNVTVNTTSPLTGGGTVALGGTLTLACGSCTGGGSPGGSDSQWQYNNASSFGGLVGTSSIPQTGWTLLNCGTLCVYNDFSSADQTMTVFGSLALNWRIVHRSTPGATYTIITRIHCVVPQGISSSTCGLYLDDGTKLEGFEVLSQATTNECALRVEHMTNVTTDSSTAAGPTIQSSSCDATLKIVNDATHRTFSYWSNGAYTQFLQETTGTFLTETNFGFGGVLNNNTAPYWVEANLRYLKATTP